MGREDRVLVGLGEGKEGARSLDWAAQEARARHARLDIVRAYCWSPGTVPHDSAGDRMIRASLRHGARDRVDAALRHVRDAWPDVRIEGRAVEGLAWDVLVAEAKRSSVTVLGSRHLGVLGSAALGSVSTVVAARSSGPVVIVPALPGPVAGDAAAVVVGVDESAATDDVLRFGFDYASRHGRALHAVYCWRPSPPAPTPWRPEEPVPERAERWLAEATAGWAEKYPDVSLRRSVVHESAVTGLTTAAKGQALLVVGGKSRHARVAALLGSVSQGVLHHATSPIAVVHPR